MNDDENNVGNAVKDQVKNEVKSRVKRFVLGIAFKYVIPVLLVLLILAGAFLVVVEKIKDVGETIVNAAGKDIFSTPFDNKSNKPVIIISDDLIKKMKDALAEDAIDIDQAYLSDYLLKKALSAYYATQYPFISTIDYTDDMVKGCIYLKRNEKDTLEWLGYNDFKALLGSNKSLTDVNNAKRYFSMDDESNIVVASWSRDVEKVETRDEDGRIEVTGDKNLEIYTIEEEKINQREILKQYAMSYKLPILLANLYSNEGFGYAVAEMAENSQIELSIMDDTQTITTVSKEYYKMDYWGNSSITYTKNGVSQTAGCPEATWNADFTKEPHVTTTHVDEYNSITSTITKLDTWVVKGAVENIQKNENKEETSDETKLDNDPKEKTLDSHKTYGTVSAVSPSALRSAVSSTASSIEAQREPTATSDATAADQTDVVIINSIEADIYKKMSDHRMTVDTTTETVSYTAANMSLVDNTDKFLALIRANENGEYARDGKLIEYHTRLDEDDVKIGVVNNNAESSTTSGDSYSEGTGKSTSKETYGNGKIGYTGTYKDSNGKKFKEWKQYPLDGTEGNGWESWLHHNGCGLTSAAIILSAKDSKYDPSYLYHYKNGKEKLKDVYIPKYLSDAGVKYTTAKSLNDMKKGLKQGKKVLLCLYGNAKINGVSWAGSSGHYITFLDISSDGKKVYVSNPGSNPSSRNGWVSLSSFDEKIYFPHSYIISL